MLIGHAKDVLPTFVKDHQIGGVITDFSPLRVPAEWVSAVSKALPSDIPLCQVGPPIYCTSYPYFDIVVFELLNWNVIYFLFGYDLMMSLTLLI